MGIQKKKETRHMFGGSKEGQVWNKPCKMVRILNDENRRNGAETGCDILRTNSWKTKVEKKIAMFRICL